MTMALSAPLQRAIYQRLSGAPELSTLAGRIYDEAPHRETGPEAGPYVTLGDEKVTPWDTATDRGAAHEAVISVRAAARGFLPAKDMAALIVDVIEASPPTPDRGRLVSAEFLNAKTAREEQGAIRRIDLTFRFIIEDDLT